MTSSIPMFIPSIILDKNVYFENCVTDTDGFLKKAKENILLDNLENCNPDSKDCFDIKLYHSKNNLYKKEINFNDFSDKKNLYLLNTIKMAFEYTAELYFKAFKINPVQKENVFLYRQDSCSLFDDYYIKTNSYKSILFLNEERHATPFKISNGIVERNLFPKAGSVVMLNPGSYYNIGYFENADRYYSMYNFKSDTI